MDKNENLLTIGQLAKQVGVRTSTLRFYEQKELLIPLGRTESGYRLYSPEAAQRIRLIQRAQRLGFSLSDIRPLLDGWERNDLSDEAVITTAENRFLSLEKQVTRLMILQHELELFLLDLHQRKQHSTENNDSAFDHLLARVCSNPRMENSSVAMFEWLLRQTGCVLTSVHAQDLLDRLRGLHVHIWQEEDTYYILVVSQETAVAEALNELARLEANCEAHAHIVPELTYGDEGYLLSVQGDNAFVFARLFLALEKEGHPENMSHSHNQLAGPYQ